jgi:hypothetical protein
MTNVPELAAAILRDSRTVAVLGMKGDDDPGAPANHVPIYLASQGYNIIPVNPELAADGYPGAVSSLTKLLNPPDIVQVFRRPDAITQHADELLELKPRYVWFQLGIHNDEVAKRLEDAGIRVIQDRCMLQDHTALREAGEI